MRNSDCHRLAKALLPQLPGFSTDKRKLIFIQPIGNVLRGFMFESTAYAREDFFFWRLFMPICGPIEYITLSYGDRLSVPGGHAGWRSDMTDLPEKLLAVMRPETLRLHAMQTPQDIISAIKSRLGKHEIDIHAQDRMACLLILDGKFNEARVMLDRIIAHERGDDQRAWILTIVERSKGLRAQLIEDPQTAVDQVKDWQVFTLKALKLDGWR